MRNFMVVTMPDQSKWSVPTNIIRTDWWKHYKTHPDVKMLDFDEDECEEWSANNMNWADVEKVAVRLAADSPAVDYQEGWINGKKDFRD